MRARAPHAHRNALAPRRPPLPSTPPRRPRRFPLHAVFIWSDDYADEAPDDADDAHDDDAAEHDFFEISDDSWKRAERSIDHSHPSASSFASHQFARRQSDDDAQQHADVPHSQHAASPHDHNPLFAAIRSNTQGPDDMHRLRQLASEGATETFRDVVVGVLGNMPTDVYEVIITTDRNGMSRLMHSSLCTGYALRNAEFRMLLNDNMNSYHRSHHERTRHDTSAVRDLFAAEPPHVHNVPRTPKPDKSTLKGVVRWWDAEHQAKQELTAAEYVAKLEAENELLRERLTATHLNGANRNQLMAFVRTLTPQKLTELQSNLSEDVVAAFKSVVKSVLGELNVAKVQMTFSTTRDYLAQLTFWCLLVGYCLRNLEKRMEMTKIFENTEAYAESALSDGDN
eukprot:TRINITY_DN70576_c0_g1_i1.p1 TRINITY_DN70576_c0_g1~~TRINITY_DN70576_c0_g1_i1.p1  ORF type:complete len:454 (-),score=104.77 TRINITY_DN70576_c0_g1_i1:1351-2544(-)